MEPAERPFRCSCVDFRDGPDTCSGRGVGMESDGSTPSTSTMRDFDGRCFGCGYQLRGLTVCRCPECGRPFAPENPATFRDPSRSVPRAKWLPATGLLAGVILVIVYGIRPSTHHTGAPGKMGAAMAMVRNNGPLSLVLGLYRTHLGKYPSRRADLVNAPTDPAESAKWMGPYIDDPHAFVDPRGAPLRYSKRGKHNPRSYDLWSVGPDGASGTADDIGNWSGRAEPFAHPVATDP
jgi:general secretion pathway protein G